MPEEKSFGSQLRKFRRLKGLSQFQLGTLLGVSDRAVSKWENNLAKPKSDLLVKLCEYLDVTSDELLEIHIDSNLYSTRGFGDYKQFWHAMHSLLLDRYGPTLSLDILSRYEKEKSAFYNTNLPQLFSLFAMLRKEADEHGHGFEVLGGIGGSFLAFLLGATDINPLPPHYYCPVCKSVEFITSIKDGWDLPLKSCSCCGELLQRDGHGIPFEVFGRSITQNTSFDVMLDRQFYGTAETLLTDFFDNYSLIIVDNPHLLFRKKLSSQAVTIVLITDSHYRTVERIHENLSCAQFSVITAHRPCINLLFDDYYDAFISLRNRALGLCESLDYTDNQLYTMLQNSQSAAIPMFVLEEFQDILRTNKPSAFSDLLHIFGVALIFAEYPSYKSMLKCNGWSVHEIIVYRDDVYQLARDKLREHNCMDSALAYMIMNDVRTGSFFRNGINDVSRAVLKSIGFSDDTITLLRRTPFLFPKSTGLIYLKRALGMMWYQRYLGIVPNPDNSDSLL